MDTPHERFIKAYELLRKRGLIHTQTDLAEKIKKPQPHINAAINGDKKRLGKTLRIAIADAFPNIINKEYMETGEGSVEIDSRETRPHFSDLPAAAGFMSGTGQIPVGENREYLPLFGNYTYSVEILGDSMFPEIHSGDTAFCEILNDKNEVKIGDIYLVDTTEGSAIKVIAKEGKADLTLHSFNPEYPDYKVLKEDILRIARVIGITRKL